MSRILTGDKLVESARSRAMIPDDTSVYTDANLLSIANEELDVQLLDKLLSLHEEHLTIPVDIPRSSTGVYEIPYRAVGNKVRDVAIIKSGQVYEMTQISIGELSDYQSDSETYSNGMDKFYVQHNYIKLIQPSRDYEYLRVYFHIRPNYLTKEEEAAKIATITSNSVTNEVTFNFVTMPSKFTSAIEYDIVGHKTPNKIKIYDLTPKSVDSNLNNIVFNKTDLDSILSEISVGDYLCKAEESPVPNIPTEMHPVLAQLTAVHVLEAMGDTEGLANAQKKLERMERSVMQLVDDRVELAPKKIKPRNSTLAEARNGFYRRRGR